jgi:hypothetical protein
LTPFKNSNFQLEIGGQYLGKNTFLTLKTRQKFVLNIPFDSSLNVLSGSVEKTSANVRRMSANVGERREIPANVGERPRM